MLPPALLEIIWKTFHPKIYFSRLTAIGCLQVNVDNASAQSRLTQLLILQRTYSALAFIYNSLFRYVASHKNTKQPSLMCHFLSVNTQNLPCCAFSRKLLVWLFSLLNRGVKSTAIITSQCDVHIRLLFFFFFLTDRQRALLPSTGNNMHCEKPFWNSFFPKI